MNIPSSSALLDRTKLIKTIQNLCQVVNDMSQTVNSVVDNAVTKEDLERNQVVVVAEQPIPNTWPTGSLHSMADLIAAINDDETAIPGRMYLSSISLADLPYYDDNGTQERLIQAEMKIEIMAKEIIPDGISESSWKKVILFTVTSTLPPYHWEYTSAWGNTGEWRAFSVS